MTMAADTAFAGRELRFEAWRFVRYLLGQDAPERLLDEYVRWHETMRPDRGAAIDRALVAAARRSTVLLALADAYARRLRPRTALRQKLVLVLALAEVTPPLHEVLDRPPESGVAAFFRAAIARGAVAALLLLTSLAVFGPLHLATAPFAARERRS